MDGAVCLVPANQKIKYLPIAEAVHEERAVAPLKDNLSAESLFNKMFLWGCGGFSIICLEP